MKRAIICMLDSLGVGAADDAEAFGDIGANTLGHIVDACQSGQCDTQGRKGPLHIPNLAKLGLIKAMNAASNRPDSNDEILPNTYYGYAQEISTGKDTPSGHWEMAGVPVLFDWGYFSDRTNSFPEELLNRIVKKANLPGYLANCHSSGTVILDQFGEEHIQSGKPIFYTSADSVFQVACHEESFGVDKLIELCELIRGELDDYNIGRVIARPFIGEKSGGFKRTGNRRDFSMLPPAATVLNRISESAEHTVTSIGKIADIYAHSGVDNKIKASGLEALFDATLEAVSKGEQSGLIFTNFVDFDSEYGHRRDITGYAAALEYFDRRLPELLSILSDDDILILTADHGCDPSFDGSDHTREYVPVILHGVPLKQTKFIGKRDTFADIGQSLASYLAVPPMDYGVNLLD